MSTIIYPDGGQEVLQRSRQSDRKYQKFRRRFHQKNGRGRSITADSIKEMDEANLQHLRSIVRKAY